MSKRKSTDEMARFVQEPRAAKAKVDVTDMVEKLEKATATIKKKSKVALTRLHQQRLSIHSSGLLLEELVKAKIDGGESGYNANINSRRTLFVSLRSDGLLTENGKLYTTYSNAVKELFAYGDYNIKRFHEDFIVAEKASMAFFGEVGPVQDKTVAR